MTSPSLPKSSTATKSGTATTRTDAASQAATDCDTDNETALELESLSALMDGQGDELELRRLLKTLDSDPAAAERMLGSWQRYHLVQDLIHDRGTPVSTNLAAQVAARIDAEPALSANSTAGWQQTFAKFAIAASVAAVFVIGMQASLQQPATSGPAPALAADNRSPAVETISGSEPSVPLPQPEVTMLADGTALTVDPQAAARLRNYLQSIAIDVSEPVVTQHIQDSPLYRLVNQVQD